MSHEIEIINGEAQIAWTGERNAVWHRLGKQVPADLSAPQMMEAAGLDWTVSKTPLFADVNGKQVDTGHSALIRSTDDRVLDVVTHGWNPVQNSEAFDFFNEFVEAGDMTMDTAGSLKDGRLIWALAKLKDGFEVFGGDKIEGYLLFSNPHQFGRCIDVKFTPVRVVCNNTLTMALGEFTENQVRHSHRSEFDEARVKRTLGLAGNRMAQYKERAEFLGSKRYNGEAVTEYFKRIFPVLTTKKESEKEISKQGARALAVLDTQPGAEFAQGTWWAAFNAATYLTSNEIGKTDESRLNSLWYGTNASRNLLALKLAVEMAEAA